MTTYAPNQDAARIAGLYYLRRICENLHNHPSENHIRSVITPYHPIKIMSQISYQVRIGACLLDSEHVMKIESLLNDFLCLQQPFLKPGYTLKQMAEDVHIPLHHLSAFINQHHGVHFNDFINEYRVNHFKIKIINEEWKRKKLEAIAAESGFNNRNTFTVAFKKLTGLNPSEYIKNIKESHCA